MELNGVVDRSMSYGMRCGRGTSGRGTDSRGNLEGKLPGGGNRGSENTRCLSGYLELWMEE